LDSTDSFKEYFVSEGLLSISAFIQENKNNIIVKVVNILFIISTSLSKL